jgi:chaperonin GroEL (HSP60 family)
VAVWDAPTSRSVSAQDSQLVAGVSFKKTFSYAGFEMQPKRYENPKIALLNIELELKKEKENAEVRIDNVEEYQVQRGGGGHVVLCLKGVG